MVTLILTLLDSGYDSVAGGVDKSIKPNQVTKQPFDRLRP
jgi:hypothetical protein